MFVAEQYEHVTDLILASLLIFTDSDEEFIIC